MLLRRNKRYPISHYIVPCGFFYSRLIILLLLEVLFFLFYHRESIFELKSVLLEFDFSTFMFCFYLCVWLQIICKTFPFYLRFWIISWLRVSALYRFPFAKKSHQKMEMLVYVTSASLTMNGARENSYCLAIIIISDFL